MTDRETRKEGIPMPVELIKYMTSITDVISPGETRTGKKIINGWTAFNRLGELYKKLADEGAEPNKGNSNNTYW